MEVDVNRHTVRHHEELLVTVDTGSTKAKEDTLSLKILVNGVHVSSDFLPAGAAHRVIR